MNARGQVAIEYISTYGWALLSVVIAVGALMYFGVFDVTSLRSDDCEFPPGITCSDHILSDELGSDQLLMNLRNTYGVDLNITQINASSQTLDFGDCTVLGQASVPPAYTWDDQNLTQFECDVDEALITREKHDILVTINFTQVGHNYDHHTLGTLFTTAQ